MNELNGKKRDESLLKICKLPRFLKNKVAGNT